MRNLNAQSLPVWWERKCNGKRYALGDLVVRAGGKIYVWMYQENSNKVLHLTLESVCRNFRAL